MKVFVPMSDDWPLDPSVAVLPLVPFQLDFPCQRDLERDGSARTVPSSVLSDGSRASPPA